MDILRVVALFFFMGCSIATSAAGWIRTKDISWKIWDGKGTKAPGKIKPAPNTNDCVRWEWVLAGDRVLEFDLTQIAENAGSSIVADKIYIDASGDGGQYALGYWLADWEEHTGQLLLPPIEGLGDWSNKRSISVCVGSKVGFKTLDKQLRSIFLWYDSTVRTTIYNIKSEPGQPVHSPTNAKNMANTDDALKVSKNGLVLRDLHQTPPSGTAPGSIPGPRVDLEPDFDV